MNRPYSLSRCEWFLSVALEVRHLRTCKGAVTKVIEDVTKVNTQIAIVFGKRDTIAAAVPLLPGYESCKISANVLRVGRSI